MVTFARVWSIVLVAGQLIAAGALTSAEAASRHVRLHLIDRTALHPRAIAPIKGEVHALWAGSHACVEWSDRSCGHCAGPATDDVYVIVVSRAIDEVPRDAIASIRFTGNEPLNHIHAYVSHGLRLLKHDADVGYLGLPSRAKDDALGRLVGRAVAHELGHYLLRSLVHAQHGLMKPSHRVAAMAARDRRPFMHEWRSLVRADIPATCASAAVPSHR